ncbi:MAG: macro domain-containing protein [Rhodomicrobiaceae bacterium]
MPQGVAVIQGDITQIQADAIVNAANTDLAMGGGVCGAIFRTAGIDALTDACNKAGYCPTGSAVITPAFNIFGAKYIIHAVGPVHDRYDPEEAAALLRSAYRNAIRLAAENDCASIAFPAISTGIYGYPLEEACHEAVAVCREEAARTGLDVKLVAFDGRTADALKQALERRA